MSRHNPIIRLQHMRDYAGKAVLMAKDRTKKDLETDEMFRYALTHLVELVGEAAAKVPPEIQKEYPQIPWPKIVSMRNRLIHGYDYIDYDILWDAIAMNLPLLIHELEKILIPEK